MIDTDLYFAKTMDTAIIPEKIEENAGYDVWLGNRDKTIIIPPNTNMMLDSGIATSFSSDFFIKVMDKGGMGSKNITTTAGVVDSGYRGSIFISLSNLSSDKYLVLTSQSEEEIKNSTDFLLNGGVFVNRADVLVVEDNVCKMPETSIPKDSCIIKDINKAITQFVVLPVPRMNVRVLPYEVLKAIPSERGYGKLGSTGK